MTFLNFDPVRGFGIWGYRFPERVALPITDDFVGSAGLLAGRAVSTGRKAWTVGGDSTWEILSGVAFRSGGNGTIDAGAPVYVDSRTANCTIAALVPQAQNNAKRCGILFRYSDDSNFWAFFTYLSGATRYYFLQSYVAGVVTVDMNTTGAHSSPTTMEVVLSGADIICKAGGVQKFSTTNSFNQSATKHGLIADEGSGFDDFSISR